MMVMMVFADYCVTTIVMDFQRIYFSVAVAAAAVAVAVIVYH